MIQSKTDLLDYLKKDKLALDIHYSKPKLFGDYIWKYEVYLRKHEYYLNCSKNKILKFYYEYKHKKLGVKLGFTIACNVIGPGLRLNHYGSVIINSRAKIGSFCSIHSGVSIGEDYQAKCPKIGDNVWIGPGAILYGDITIADDIMIGANAVVNKSFTTPHCRIAGIPAKVISNKGNAFFHPLTENNE